MLKTILCLGLLIFSSCGVTPSSEPQDPRGHEESLKTVDIEFVRASPSSVTVSGVSSGAYMATQLAFAYPEIFVGVGSIAGGPRGCAQGNVWTATSDCMESPAKIDVTQLVEKARRDSTAGRIGQLSSLASARVFLLNSDRDSVIRPPMSDQLQSFYRNFVKPNQLKVVSDVHSEHGLPTMLSEEPCSKLGAPFLMNCGYDAAGDMLQFLLKPMLPKMTRTTADLGSLYEFDFSPFHEPYSFFSEKALIYIPQACLTKRCPLHVALHGCSQGSEVVKAKFALQAGYNEWAQGSDLVVLYPQIDSSLVNPKGCFDWFGYTGVNYVDRESSQMKSIVKAVEWFTRP